MIREAETKQRQDFIDILRALAMLMVIYNHIVPRDHVFNTFTAVLKLPLFITISGYFLKTNIKPQTFFAHKCRTLLMPVALLALIRMMGRVGLAVIRHNSVLPVVQSDLMLLITGRAMWFIPSLFVIELLIYIQERLVPSAAPDYTRKARGICLRVLISIVIVLCGFFLLRLNNALPWHIGSALIMTVFGQLGLWLAANRQKLQKTRPAIGAVLLVVYVIMIVLEATLNIAKIDPNRDYWPCLPLNLVTACIGIVGLFIVAQRLPKLRVLIWVGRNTLLLYALHESIAHALTAVFSRLLPKTIMTATPFPLLVFVITMFVCVPIIIIINRYLPELAGKKRIRARSGQ